MAASLKSIRCENCGAPISIRAPGISVTFACASCGSVIDSTREGYKLLNKATRQHAFLDRLIIPLGSRGVLFDVEWEVIGAASRQDVAWGFFWDEYLLFNPYHGFRFLTHSDFHFSFVEVLTKRPTVSMRMLYYDECRYSLYHKGISQVTAVVGEFYWRIRVGDRCEFSDFIAPPRGISMEVPQAGSDAETTFSLAHYLTLEDVKLAFGVWAPFPSKVSPIQPNRLREALGSLWVAAIIASLVIFVAQMYFVRSCDEQVVLLSNRGFSRAEAGVEQLIGEIEIQGRPRNVEIRSYSPVSNSWVEVTYELESQDGAESGWASQAIEYYFGRSDGESWSEGSTRVTSVIGALSPRRYKVFATVDADSFSRDMTSSLETAIRVDVPIWSNFFISISVLLLFPLLIQFLAQRFEQNRWSESDFSPYGEE